MSRPVVGIDLGTTHCALAHASGGGVVTDEIPQLVAPGEVAKRTLLPSALYLPGPELHASMLKLPWTQGDEHQVIGELARAQGALVPSRLVTSAKSWLGHARVDRLAPILPWGIDEDGLTKVSPVTASSAYLRHLAAAFTHTTGIELDRADVVLGVPASFDEVARQLTLRAAQEAGLSPTLLEEPQAAFYAWLEQHAARWKEQLDVGSVVLVCDIGGGTTDFTLLRVIGEDHGQPQLERTAVGDHLLLGGDNMDLALARRAESRMKQDGRLEPAPFVALTQACRVAKEHLLDDARDPDARKSWTVTVAGRGSRLIGGALHDEITREEAEELLLDGFFPRVGADAAPAKKSALQEFGLPYAADPAITRHLAAFLRAHGSTPTHVLWNGGVTKSPAVRQRLLEVLSAWGATVRELPGAAPDLGVARGAAYYALARRGEGVRIGGGSARAYYVGVETAQVTPGHTTLLCVAPRGMIEGQRVAIDSHPLEVVTNKPVRFRLFSSAEASHTPGALVSVPDAELDTTYKEQEPLHTVLRFVRSSQDVALHVSLAAHLSELGALEVELVARSTGHEADRWRLAFDLRAAVSREPHEERRVEPREGQDPAALTMAIEIVRSVYGSSDSRFADVTPQSIMKALQAPLGPKDGWTPTTLRALWEPLKDLRGGRGKSPAHEARWMNLAGFCLRPGFGYALDDWRVKETWRLFNAGLVYDKDAPCRLEWWVMWRRISGGLTKTQQDEIWKRLQPFVAPKTKERRSVAKQELAEMWRAIASMERLPGKVKGELGDVLLGELEKKEAPEHALWALGRLGARVPLYGAVDEVVPAKKATRWLERLMAMAWKGEPEAFAAAELARMSGDRARDLDEPLRKKLAERLRQTTDGERLARLVLEPVAREATEERLAFGDALPLGLRLSAPDVT